MYLVKQKDTYYDLIKKTIESMEAYRKKKMCDI